MKKFLISGAAGMVGRAIIEEIAANHKGGIEVYASDRFLDTLAPYEGEHVHILLNDRLEEIMQTNTFDCMLQLAFPRNVQPDQWADGIKFCTETLFMAHKYDVKRIVHVSSQSLYGWQREDAADENTAVQLVSPYTTGKYATEVLVNNLFADRPHTNVRLSTIIGPYTRERVVNKFFEQILENKDITVKGGNQIFSFLDVRDAASGFVAIMNNEAESWRPVYNLGTSEYATLMEIAEKAIEIGKQNGYTNSELVHEPAEIVLNNKIDVSNMLNDFGWKAQFSLQDTMNHIFNFLTSK